jgi:hypothetical protein
MRKAHQSSSNHEHFIRTPDMSYGIKSP